MVLFINASGTGRGHSKVIVPLSRIFDICAAKSEIVITYDNGDCEHIAGVLTVKYNNHNEVENVFRQFYKACEQDKKVFYFGGNYSEKQTDEMPNTETAVVKVDVQTFDKAIEYLFS